MTREVDPALRRSRFDMNDLGNARRLQEAARGRLLYVGELKCWVAFDGRRWAVDEGDAVALGMAQTVAEGLQDEVMALASAERDDLSAVYGPKFSEEMRTKRAGALYDWAMKSGNAERARAMLTQASGLRIDTQDGEGRFLMRAKLNDFDQHKLAFHCQNGTVRFVEDADGGWGWRFDPGHDPADMFMQIAGVFFQQGAQCPHWIDRLNVLHRDPLQRTAIQRIYGMTLTAFISDQAFYVFQGKGGDGKSMTNKIIGGLLGDYFRSSSPQTFLEGKQRNASDHQSDIVRLSGDVRLVVCDEPKKGSVWNAERIKQVTGSKVTARAPNARDEITFEVHWQLIVECNSLPRAPTDDRGFRRRLNIYPWQIQYGITPGVEEEPSHIVEERLTAELSGILNWMIQGTVDWLNTNEVPQPDMMKLALDSFWASSSDMGEWLQSCCDLSDPDAFEGATVLYKHFKDFCIDKGVKEEAVLSQTKFGSLLNEAQIYGRKDVRGNKVRKGIKIRSKASGLLGDAPSPARPGADDYDVV